MGDRIILVVAGTRPEAIKVAPVLRTLKTLGEEYRFVWSGQHSDFNMSRIFFRELDFGNPDTFLEVNHDNGSLFFASDLARRLQKLIDRTKPSVVYALGDTTTTLGVSLAANYSRAFFVHDEAGMRSFDNSMEEEINRKVADVIADLHLAPTKLAMTNLLWEGFQSSSMKLVGSTLVDSLMYALPVVRKHALDILTQHSLEKGRYSLVTVHRRENLRFPNLTRLVRILVEIARRHSETKLIFPVHPHTQKRLRDVGLWHNLTLQKNILLIQPLGYIDFLSLLDNALVTITDSGGVQEEAFLLGKGTLTLRKTTEWPETVIWKYNILTGLNLSAVQQAYEKLINRAFRAPSLDHNPLGDGMSGQRVARILVDIQSSPRRKPVRTRVNTVETWVRQLETNTAVIFDGVGNAKYALMDYDTRSMSKLLSGLAEATKRTSNINGAAIRA
jgi:UDP-N-acetylglucosamine 2-epimerase (non-hydrolysing)